MNIMSLPRHRRPPVCGLDKQKYLRLLWKAGFGILKKEKRLTLLSAGEAEKRNLSRQKVDFSGTARYSKLRSNEGGTTIGFFADSSFIVL